MTPPLRFAFIGFAFITSFGFSQPTLLTEKIFPELQPILANALQQSPRMLERNLELDAASGDLLQARAGLYPAVSAYFQDSRTRDQREDVPGTLKTDKLYYNLSVSQPLYHWGAISNRAKIGEIREK